ncbi:hypothetical protein ACFC1B_00650 [Streptomyces xiamenensis]|uniref:hypothetical protein n=1 Tax=Streptomyces xiamenensis TaxID=408015 RepID=UPI0035DC7575
MMQVKVKFKGFAQFEPRISQGADSLVKGREYPVLEMFSQADGQNYFRIEYSENEIPALFDSRLFEMTDARIPSSWSPVLEWDGSVVLQPIAWSMSGFWEAFTDHDQWAVEIYRVERDRLMRQA